MDRPTGKATTRKLIQLVEYQDFKCALSGRQLTPETASLDHMTAVSRGGDHKMENIHVLHAEINAMKRTMSIEEFVAACKEVAACADSQILKMNAG